MVPFHDAGSGLCEDYFAAQGIWRYTAGVDASDRDWLAQARRGVVELCVLLLLDHEPTYGYQLGAALRAWQPLAAPEGTLYPLLHRLTRQGVLDIVWREGDAGPPRKYYRLTDSGRQLLEAQLTEWHELTRAVAELRDRNNDEDKGVPDGSRRNLTLSERTAAAPGATAAR